MKASTDSFYRMRQPQVRAACRVIAPSMTRESYTCIKKDESRDTGVATEKKAAKVNADGKPETGQIAPARRASPIPNAIATSIDIESYLAIKWQSVRSEGGFTCRDRRFPTPPSQPRNNGEKGGLLTTSHVFWPNEGRQCGFLLPIRLPNPNFLASKRNRVGREGGGAQPDGADQIPVSIRWLRKFAAKGRLPGHYEHSNN